MIIFKRDIEPKIKDAMFGGKIIVLLGPRQSGKTTLSKKLIADYGAGGAYYDCQLAEVRERFIMGKPDLLLPLVEKKKVVVFDEAQTVQDIGSILKAYHDTYRGAQIIATGSSSFDLANKIKEPMTGRAREFSLLPLSLKEVKSAMPGITRAGLDDLMLYGAYPAIVASETKDEKLVNIKSIATNYLYKDIFVFESIRSPRVFEELLKMIAYQIGSMVSVNELAQGLGITRSTVNRYLSLLEQSFIIKRVYAFSNNPRNEIKKGFKIFFLDTGVRNALADIASPMAGRADKGAIFENFFFSEMMKRGTLEIFPPEIMFWRSRSGQEIDIIEKSGARISAFECKWNDASAAPPAFARAYPGAEFTAVNTENILRLTGG